MRSLSIKTYLSLLSVCSIAAIALIVMAVILPTISRIESINTDLTATKATIDLRSQRGTVRTEDAQALDAIAARAQSLRAGAVEPGHELALITELEALAEKQQIEQTLTLSSSLEANIFSVRASGSYDNLLRYLDTLSRQPYYTIIERLTLRKQRDAVGGGTLVMEFPLKVYVQQR